MEAAVREPQAVGDVFGASFAPGEAGGKDKAVFGGQLAHAPAGGVAGGKRRGLAAGGVVAGEAELGEKEQVETFPGRPGSPGGGGGKVAVDGVYSGGAGDGAHP